MRDCLKIVMKNFPPFQILDRSTFWTQIGIGIDSLMMQVAPCFILGVLTPLIILKLKETQFRRETLSKNGTLERQEKESARAEQTGNALLAIVILFLVCELPIASLTFASIFDFAIMRNVALRVLNFACMLRLLNSSLNFILYCIMSSQFRNEFRKLFTMKILARVLTEQNSDGKEATSSV